MNKYFLIAIAAFGGLILVSSQFSNDSTEVSSKIVEEKAQVSSIPVGVPIYPDSIVDNTTESTGDDGTYFLTVSLLAEATKAEVNTWYRKALNEKDWSITSDRNVAGYQIIQAENDNMYTSFQTANGGKTGQVVISQQIRIEK
jgi:hypothetical protein